MLVVMAVEGVLTKAPDLHTEPPTVLGKNLFATFKDQHRLLLLSTNPDHALVREWLLKERFKGYASLQCKPKSSAMSDSDWKANTVRNMLSEGWEVGTFFDADPKAVQAVFMEGVPSFLLAAPQYARPEWRPDADRSIRPWDQLVSTIEKESLVKED